MLYTRIYGTNKLKEVKKYLRTGNIVFDYISSHWIFVFMRLAPDMFQSIMIDGLKTLLDFLGLRPYPTLRIFALFIVCYFFSYYFLSVFAKMFLQVFEYKADSSIYIFIVFAWIIYLIQNSVRVVAYIFGSKGLFIPYIIVHLLLSLMGAPICQLIFVVYVAYALVGSPSNLKDLGLSFIFKTVKSFFVDVEIDTLKSVASSNTTILGGFDNLAYLYGYRYFTFFIFMLFFFFKTIQGAIELKIRAIRTSISSTNAYITATMLVIYFAKYLNDEPVPTQEFTIGKKASPEVPAAQGLDGATAAAASALASQIPGAASAVEGVLGSDGAASAVEGVLGSDGAAAGLVQQIPGADGLTNESPISTKDQTQDKNPVTAEGLRKQISFLEKGLPYGKVDYNLDIAPLEERLKELEGK